MTKTPLDAPAPSMTVASLIDYVRTTDLSSVERAAILRALRETVRDLVPPDPSLNARLRTARAVRPLFVESTINGIAASTVWQQSAAVTPDELRTHLTFETNRPFIEELQASNHILDYNLRYHHWAAVEKSRTAYHAGKTLGGAEGHLVKPHLQIMAGWLPKSQRRTPRFPRVAIAIIPARSGSAP